MMKLALACVILAVAFAQPPRPGHPGGQGHHPFRPRPTGDGPRPTGDGPRPSGEPHIGPMGGHTHPPLDCQKILETDCSSLPEDHNRPVCGSDDVTYGGMCAFGQAKCKNEDLTVQWFAACEDGRPTGRPFRPHHGPGGFGY